MLFFIGMRVKSLRAGCLPTYGTVLELLGQPEDGTAQDRWVRVRWDHGPVCNYQQRDLSPVKIDRSAASSRVCRYCGWVTEEFTREGKDNCLAYACKDAEACGARIRESQGVTPEQARKDSSPF